MRRREFVTLLGSAAVAWPLGAHAQEPGRLPRVGYLATNSEGDAEAQAAHAAFREALEKLGWADGHNIRIDYHWGASTPERQQAAAAELVGLAPNVILAQASSNSEALRRETRTIPIVFVNVSDPLSSGLVDSMAHPGGNLTGFANFEFSMGGKWLEILKEVAPGINRVLVILTPGNIGNEGLLRAVEAAAPTLGVQPVAAAIPGAPEIERVISVFVQEPNGGLLVLPGSAGNANRDLIVGLAARHRVPAMYTSRRFIVSGGLMSYDTDVVDLYRRAASYVDRILRGQKPGDLPVQVPTKYELVINLKAAKALGLTVPLPLLARADEVIE
jgi:putative ABC transport system substrate-binding protein